MVLVILQLCPCLVSSRCYSFGLSIRSLFSSLPVPFPDNIRSLSFSLFYSLPIPFPSNICAKHFLGLCDAFLEIGLEISLADMSRLVLKQILHRSRNSGGLLFWMFLRSVGS